MESKPLTLNLFITMIRYAGSLYVVLGRISKPQENLWIDSYGIIVVQLRTNYYGLCLFLIVAGLTTRGWSFLVMLYWTIFAGDVSFFFISRLKACVRYFFNQIPPPLNDSPSKTEKCFYFILKALFVLKIFRFLFFSASFPHFPDSKGQTEEE